MANIQNDDCLLVGRDSVDYRINYSDLVDNLNGDLTIPDSGIEEAPNDGEQYVRQNEAWAKVEIPDAGLEEAPEDGQIYGRKNKGWEAMSRYMPYDITTLPEL